MSYALQYPLHRRFKSGNDKMKLSYTRIKQNPGFYAGASMNETPNQIKLRDKRESQDAGCLDRLRGARR